MLELNPRDNQGHRDYLLGVYLALNDLDGAAGLYRQYDDDSAVFVWGRVFLLMLRGRRKEARTALTEAFHNNPGTAAFLFGERAPDDPDSWGVGDEDEGDHAASALLPACAQHPDIVVWIAKEGLEVMQGLMASGPGPGASPLTSQRLRGLDALQPRALNGTLHQAGGQHFSQQSIDRAEARWIRRL